ncbi:MAG: hypothetical protein LBI72_03655 [Flavobacteriaceae bacterium]|jgi:hypothetical protein|nr:hypothetical protein [Flavobacteriaceae bacterium]
MKTKIQLKLNSDVLITVIQMIEQTDNYLIETTLDAILISIKEDLVDKLIDKSKNIQKQVSILDHNKKHLVVLKYHEAYTLCQLLQHVDESKKFDNNIQIKKIKRLITELQNKIDINTKEDVEECNAPLTNESIEFNTYAYPIEDNASNHLTDLVYAIAMDAIDKLPDNIQTLDNSSSLTEEPIINNEVVAETIAEVEESIINEEVTTETIAEVEEPSISEEITTETIAEVEEPIISEEITTETIAEVEEPIVSEEVTAETITEEEPILNKEVAAETIAEVEEPILNKEVTTETIAEVEEPTLNEEVAAETITEVEESILNDEVLFEEATTEEILAKAVKTANKKRKKNTEEQSTGEVVEKKEKVKKAPKTPSDLGQMSLF